MSSLKVLEQAANNRLLQLKRFNVLKKFEKHNFRALQTRLEERQYMHHIGFSTSLTLLETLFLPPGLIYLLIASKGGLRHS